MPRKLSVRGSRLMAAGVGLALMASCAVPVRPYVAPPATTATARLHMRGTLQPGENYAVFFLAESRDCSGPQRIGTGTANSNPAVTTILAGGIRTVDAWVTKPNRTYCSVRWSFEPRAGHSYLLSTASLPDGCRALVFDATNPDKLVPEPTSRRRNRAGSACIPLAQTQTLAALTSSGKDAGDAASELPIPAPANGRPAAPQAIGDDDLQGLIRP